MSALAQFKRFVKQVCLPGGMRPHTIRAGLLKGRRMNLDLHVDTQVWRGIYERSLQRWLKEAIRPDSISLDIGAAEGWATLQMALFAPQGRVYAFEPSNRIDWVEPNVLLNPEIDPAAVAIERAYVGGAESPGEGGEPPYVTIDDYVDRAGIERVDAIKIDVDGPELDVLAGAARTLDRWRPQLCVESHSPEATEGTLALMHGLGYTTRVEDAEPHEYRPIGYNPQVFGTPPA